MPTMKASTEWLRASIASRAVSVDRKANVLRGYVLAQAGPFKSDGRGEFDDASIREIVALGNTKSAGLKSRFTHPDMSNDGLGKFLGRAKDLRVEKATDARTGKQVSAARGDLYFDATALDTPPNGGKPLGVYVMDLAESDPDALSSSLVLQVDQEFRINKDGTAATDADGKELPPLWRPKVLHASDIVDTGDAVDGLLSAQLDVEGLPLSALWRGAELLDSIFEGQERDVIETRLHDYVTRYLNRKFGEQGTPKLDALAAMLDEMARKALKA